MSSKRNGALAMLAGLMSLFLLQLRAEPGDWPQWRGPDRNSVSTETGLLKEWPKEGLKLLWKATGLGTGFATPSVSNGRVYVIGSKDNEEYLMVFNAEDGKPAWSTKIGAVGPNTAPQQYPGPRSTPTVEGDVVYTLGSDGDLICAETANGQVRWRKNLRKDFKGKSGKWAYAESPLIDGDHLICTPGGPTATIVSLDKKTGETVWKSAIADRSDAAYASPIVAEVGNIRQYVVFLSGGLVGVSAKDGKLLWRYDRIANTTANIPSPLFHDGYVFSANGYGAGCALVKLSAEGDGVSAKEVYFKKDVANQIGGAVRVGEDLFVTTDKGGNLICMDFKTGAPKWQNSSVGKGALLYADGNLYVRGEKGTVALVEATAAGYKERGRFSQPDRGPRPAWPYPVVANGRLYLRDNDVLLCYDVKAK